jgi:mannitol/fructose-specific phosphotransferase system IIA component (Ntr-type)
MEPFSFGNYNEVKMNKELVDLLQEETIRLNISVKTWQEALSAGVQLLIDTGGVEKRYLENIFKMIDELGPYIVIAPGIALGHSGPDAGVNFTCFSLVTLKEPVNFGVPENDPINIIFSFGAPSKEAHMKALRQMALFCMESENLEAIRKAEDVSDIRNLLIDYFKNK